MCVSMTWMALAGSPARIAASVPNRQSVKLGFSAMAFSNSATDCSCWPSKVSTMSESGMSDREIGVELNGLPSETMRAFEGGGAQKIFVQRVDPSKQVSIRKRRIGARVVRVEGDGALEELPRFIKVGHVERRPHRACR